MIDVLHDVEDHDVVYDGGKKQVVDDGKQAVVACQHRKTLQTLPRRTSWASLTLLDSFDTVHITIHFKSYMI